MTEFSYWLSHESDVNGVIVRLLQLAWIAAAVGAARAILVTPRTQRDRIAVLLVALFALSRRWVWAPMFRNENQHGWMYFTDVACAEPVRDIYGFGYFALHVPFLQAFGVTPEVLFWVQLAVSVITPLVAMSLVTGLGWSRDAASLVGLMIGANDLLARNGRSEDMLVPAIAALLIAADRMLAWLSADEDGATGRGLLDLVAAVGALVVATQTRPEMYVLAPLLVGAVVLGTPAARRGLVDPARRVPLVGALALAGLWLVVPVHNLLFKLTHGEQTAFHTLFEGQTSFWDRLLNQNLPQGEVGNVLWVDAIVPHFVPIAACVGLLFLLRSRPGQALGLVVVLLLTLRIWLPSQGTPEGAARLQGLPVLLACLFAGYGLAEVARLLGDRTGIRPIAVPVILVVFLGGTGDRLTDRAPASNNGVAQAVALAGLASLPPDADLILPAGDHVVNSFFFECHETLTRRGVQVVRMLPGDVMPEKRPGRAQVFWEGTPCWSFANAQEATGRTIRHECEVAREACPSAVDGLELTTHNQNLDIVTVTAEALTFGFYACAP